MITKKKDLLRHLLYILLSVLLAFLLSGIFIYASGKSPLLAMKYLITGGFGRLYSIADIFVKASPLIVIALGVSLCFKAGLTNLGGDGQFYMGAIASTMVGLNLANKLPAFIVLLLAMLSGMLSGGIWGGVVGFLKAKFKTNEIILTLMTNFIALYVLRYLVEGPCMDPNLYLAQTAEIPKFLRFTRFIPGYRLNSSILIVVVLVIFVHVLITRTSCGYCIQVIGNAGRASSYAGINNFRYTLLLMSFSGALSGIAGFIEVYAIQFRTLEGITDGFGFTAVMISLIANNNALGVVVAALFISGMQIGANAMQVNMSVPSSIVSLTLGFTVFLLMVVPIIIGQFRKTVQLRQLGK